MIPSKTQLQELLPGNSNIDMWHPLVEELFPQYDMGDNNPRRTAGFMAQTSYESRDWQVIEENLNYSAAALNRVFAKYFRHAGVNPWDYHRQPEKIANYVYAGRMGNGRTESGDGWRYRGRGIIQLTGKNNYESFAKHINLSLDETVKYLSTHRGALESALWFWKTNDLNILADRQDIRGMTRRINGGYHGLSERRERWHHALDLLMGDDDETDVNLQQILKIGARGETVRWAQEKMNIPADGVFGPLTYDAVIEYQQENGLTVDGIIGPQTLEHLSVEHETSRSDA